MSTTINKVTELFLATVVSVAGSTTAMGQCATYSPQCEPSAPGDTFANLTASGPLITDENTPNCIFSDSDSVSGPGTYNASTGGSCPNQFSPSVSNATFALDFMSDWVKYRESDAESTRVFRHYLSAYGGFTAIADGEAAMRAGFETLGGSGISITFTLPNAMQVYLKDVFASAYSSTYSASAEARVSVEIINPDGTVLTSASAHKVTGLADCEYTDGLDDTNVQHETLYLREGTYTIAIRGVATANSDGDCAENLADGNMSVTLWAEDICPADISGDGVGNEGIPDGVVTLSDFSYYLNLWSSQDPAADLGGPPPTGFSGAIGSGCPDGVIDLVDFSIYLSLWSGGGCQPVCMPSP